MKMLIYLLDLVDDPDKVERYLERHKHVEPEVPKKLAALGVLQNRITRLGNRLVNVLLVEDDFQPGDLSRYTENEACARWDREMMGYQQKAPGAREDDWWASTETVYLFDTTGIK